MFITYQRLGRIPVLRVLGLVGTERAPASQGDDIIEGVVNRSSEGMLAP